MKNSIFFYIIYNIKLMFEDIIPVGTLMVIKAIRPLLRKNLMQKISEEQYLIINTIIILVLLILYFFIKQYMCNHTNPLSESIKYYFDMTVIDKGTIIILSLMTIVSTLATFKIEKSQNQSVNTILMKIANGISIIAISYYTNKQKITNKMIMGYFILFIGLLMIDDK
jgi:hypothetical protein